MLKKTIKYMCICSSICILITVFCMLGVFYGLDIKSGNYLIKVIVPVALIIIGVILVATLISSILADKLTTPIRDIDLFAQSHEGIYAEITPLVERIEFQNREIARQIDRVKRQKSRLYVVGESMSEGLIVFDGDGKILSMNSSAEKIFGADSRVIGDNISSISSNLEIYEAIEHACSGGKAIITERISDKPYQIFVSPAVDKGLVSSVIMLVFDVSELEKSEKIRREFSANVSHELKTPLTTILGYSQIINNGIAKTEDISNFMGKIEHETTRLISLVDDIMKLSRLDEENSTDNFSEITLMDVIEDVCERLLHRANKNNVSLVISGDTSSIAGDLLQITELVYNLTDNAIKYNKPGGMVTISVSGNILTVKDTGIGIPEKYFDRIYERFFRVDKSHSKKIGGTGLGLSIVKHIAQRHGATINLESRENIGTIFTVTFQKFKKDA
ncbi:MAG: PAS domain S-box protein [Ruminococcaceae bacterium]|nr:PAS domain S-box protein [Oscillospiraceae bacterium]